MITVPGSSGIITVPGKTFFTQLFPLLKKFGATGLLIEYEDMFPYSGPLEEIASAFAYRYAI